MGCTEMGRHSVPAHYQHGKRCGVYDLGALVAARDKKTGRVLKKDGAVAAPGERVEYQNQQLTPDKRRAGETFRQFVKELRELGYTVE